MPATVSVVIVNWNTRDMLRACLASLPWSSPALSVEAVVVDNGSTDGSREMVVAEFAQARLLLNDDNLGFVKATNQGLAAATGDYLWLLNSDTEVQPGCLGRLVEVLGADPSVGAVAPKLLNSDGTYQFSAGVFPQVWLRMLPSQFEHRYNLRQAARLDTAVTVVEADWLVGAALLTRRDVIEAVGPLDERYYMWWDDIDWGQKLRKGGYRRLYVPDAEVVHHGRQSGRKLEDWRLAEQLFDSEYTYLRLHAGRLVTWLIYLSRTLKALGRWCLPLRERDQAAVRLRYHWQRAGRILFGPMPQREDHP